MRPPTRRARCGTTTSPLESPRHRPRRGAKRLTSPPGRALRRAAAISQYLPSRAIPGRQALPWHALAPVLVSQIVFLVHFLLVELLGADRHVVERERDVIEFQLSGQLADIEPVEIVDAGDLEHGRDRVARDRCQG